MQVMQALDRWLERARSTALAGDIRGATLVQFVAILPFFVFLVFGAWSTFRVLVAHQRLCDAAYEAARYLQVEGPLFPDDWVYPTDWERVGRDIAYWEIASNEQLRDSWETTGVVTISPSAIRTSPKEPGEVDRSTPRRGLFSVRVTGQISNPLGVFYPVPTRRVGTEPDPGAGDEPEDPARYTLTLSCQATGFFEGPPFKATEDPRGGATICPPLPRCTDGPRPTDCIPRGRCPTPTPGCPVCEPFS